MCTSATRVFSHLFGPSRRRFSVSIPQAQLSLFDWSKLLLRSNEQRDDWLFDHCVTALKQVFHSRFLPDSDTCRITKQRGPRSAAPSLPASLPPSFLSFCLNIAHTEEITIMHRAVMLLTMGSFRSDDKK